MRDFPHDCGMVDTYVMSIAILIIRHATTFLQRLPLSSKCMLTSLTSYAKIFVSRDSDRVARDEPHH